jgi:hypothetical protein
MWWEGRTMNFHVGKFKIQHCHMILEFQWTSMNCGLEVVQFNVSTSSPEPQHPLIAGALPSAAPDVLPQQLSHDCPVFTLTDPPATPQSAAHFMADTHT